MNIFGGHLLKNRNLFSQTLADPSPKTPFIVLSSVESTNNYAMAKLHDGMLTHGTSLIAIEQTKGKGQRGKEWISTPGQNITMSTVFAPATALSAENASMLRRFPFVLSAITALSCYDFIKASGVPDLSIKWPNDLYIGDRKAGGILIENIIRSNEWEWAVIGTGINLNQQQFPDLTRKATSLLLATGKAHDLIPSAKNLQNRLNASFERLNTLPVQDIMANYNQLLFRKGENVTLKKQNIVFNTTIVEVTIDGLLVTSDSLERKFQVGEVEFT